MYSKHSFTTDTRAASFQIGTILALVILTVLVTGVVTTTGNLVQDTQHEATEEELTITGERIASEIMTTDQLLQKGENPSATIIPLTPDRISGSHYTLELQNTPSDGKSQLILHSPSPTMTVTIPFTHGTPVKETTVSSGGVVITTTSTGELTLEEQ